MRRSKSRAAGGCLGRASCPDWEGKDPALQPVQGKSVWAKKTAGRACGAGGGGGEGRPVLLAGTLQEKPEEPGSFVGQGTDEFGVWVLLGGQWDYFGGKQLKEVELMEVKESAQFPSFWQSLASH